MFGRRKKKEQELAAAQAASAAQSNASQTNNTERNEGITLSQKKRIAVLTSGGDAPGMNAAIRAVVRTGIYMGYEMLGVYRGYNGLLTKDVKVLELRDVSDIIQRGGTMLFTARSPEYNTPEGVEKAAQNCHELGVEGLVVIGGDGSFRGALDIASKGINCIGIPGTIDNDISCSDYTIGFDTAMNTAMRMVDNLRDTTQSHDRCSIVEVMGRNAGYLALRAGIACGATAVIVKEVPHNLDDIIEQMYKAKASGKQHFILVVAEGVGGVEDMAKYIEQKTGIESRATILGHVQRGGSPTVRDRVIATQMGYHAVELLARGESRRVVAMKDETVVDYPIVEALQMHKEYEFDLHNIAHIVSI